MNSLSDWLCNVMLWGGIVTFLALLSERYVSQGLLGNALASVAGLVLVAVLAAFWPKY
ncbi:MAG TPA: hypothetical protein VFA64_12695 [Hyphomicrobiaceae bacterium]|nr:hypothetical protein [Hyphomicrobiaceae bacterium]